MNDLGFDPRPYCERLAKACPERFPFKEEVLGNNPWAIEDRRHITGHVRAVWDECHIDYLWMFFGPLADERRVTVIQCTKGIALSSIAWWRDTLLESIIAAVVESFESEVKGLRHDHHPQR